MIILWVEDAFESALRWENPEQGNDEIHGQIRHQIVVRLASPDRRDDAGIHRGIGSLITILAARPTGPEIAARIV
jgi:hypothetical protein